jgi:hypothetical protein
MSKTKVDLTNKPRQLTRTRLAKECSKLDPKEEKALAEEGLDRKPGSRADHSLSKSGRTTGGPSGTASTERAQSPSRHIPNHS